MKSPITTHVLDTSVGQPATQIPVTLEMEQSGSWREIAKGHTNTDGRAPDLLPVSFVLTQGTYRITFELAEYFRLKGRKSFYPLASVTFIVDDPKQHYHVPLLLNGFGFSTYRGS